MDKNIKSIIDDLQQIDPSLKKQEKDLEKLVEKLIEAKPDIKMDKVFVSGLRRSLSAKADEMSTATPKKFGFMNFLYAFGGTAMALVIIVSIFGQNKVGVPMPSSKLEFNINEIVDEAPVNVDIEILPIIKTQKAPEPVVEQIVEPSIPADKQVEDEELFEMVTRSIDDSGYEGEGEVAEESVGSDGGGAAFFNGPMTGTVEATPDEEPSEVEQYYLDLLDVCETRSKPDCCTASIEVMMTNQYQLMTADGCLEGFKMGMLSCGSDIRWCE